MPPPPYTRGAHDLPQQAAHGLPGVRNLLEPAAGAPAPRATLPQPAPHPPAPSRERSDAATPAAAPVPVSPAGLTDSEQRLCHLLASGIDQPGALATAADLSRQQVQKLLGNLVAAGVATHNGERGPAVRYQLVDPAQFTS